MHIWYMSFLHSFSFSFSFVCFITSITYIYIYILAGFGCWFLFFGSIPIHAQSDHLLLHLCSRLYTPRHHCGSLMPSFFLKRNGVGAAWGHKYEGRGVTASTQRMELGDTAVAVNLLLCFVLTEGGKVYPTSMAAGKRPSLDVNCTTDEHKSTILTPSFR